MRETDGAAALATTDERRISLSRLVRLIGGPRGAATVAILVAAVVVAVALAGLVRQFTFLADEWVFIIERRVPSAESLLNPYNNHWQTLPILAYQIALGLRGLASFPLLAAAAAVGHALAALSLFAALRNVRPGFALAAGLALLAFAWSDEVLLWPVTLSFTLPVAFGFAAVALWTRARPHPVTDAAGMLALVAALASGGVAIAIGAVATGIMLVQAEDRRRVAWPAVAWLVYGAWYLAFGLSGDALANAATSDLTLLPAFIARGLASLAAPALGQDHRFQDVSLLVIAAGLGLTAGRMGARPVQGWIAIAGVALLYGIVGLARLKNYGVDGSEAPRYAYPAFALLLFGVATIGDRLYDSTRSLSVRRLIAAGVAGWLVVSLAGDAGKLARSTITFADRAAAIRTELWLLETLRPAFDGQHAAAQAIDRRWFGNMTPAAYFRVVDAIGDLPGPVESPRAWPASQRRIGDELLGRLFLADLSLEPIGDQPEQTTDSADRRYGLHDMTIATAGPGCIALAVTGGDPFVALRLRDGESIAVRTDGQRTMQVHPKLLTDEFGAVVTSILPTPGTWYSVQPPRLGEDWPWHLRVDAPPGSSTLDVCLVPPGGRG